jgi:hypothetical protein
MWLTQVETEGHGLVESGLLNREEQGDEFLLMGPRLSEGASSIPTGFGAATQAPNARRGLPNRAGGGRKAAAWATIDCRKLETRLSFGPWIFRGFRVASTTCSHLGASQRSGIRRLENSFPLNPA